MHPVTITLHVYLSWKTGRLLWLPIRNVLSIKSLVCVSVLTSLNCYMTTLRLVDALFLTHACWKSNNTNARLMAFALFLALDPTFGKHDGNLSHGKFSYSLFVRSFSEPTISQISNGNTELSSRLDDYIAKLSIQNRLQIRHWPVNPKTNYYRQVGCCVIMKEKNNTPCAFKQPLCSYTLK